MRLPHKVLICLALLCPSLGCGPYYDSEPSPIDPQVFLATPATGAEGGLLIAISESLDDCLQGESVATVIPREQPELVARQQPCSALQPATLKELHEHELAGYVRGDKLFPSPKRPYAGARNFAGTHVLSVPGEEFFIQYNERWICVVWGRYGNRWGGEVTHQYRVVTTSSGRTIETKSSTSRNLALEWMPYF